MILRGDMDATWIEHTGSRGARRHRLSDAAVTIGSGDGCRLRLDDPSVAPLHAKVEPHGAGWTIVDMASPGGTFVNGVRVHSPTPIAPGDALSLGSCVLHVVRGDAVGEGRGLLATRRRLLAGVVALGLGALAWTLARAILAPGRNAPSGGSSGGNEPPSGAGAEAAPAGAADDPWTGDYADPEGRVWARVARPGATYLIEFPGTRVVEVRWLLVEAEEALMNMRPTLVPKGGPPAPYFTMRPRDPGMGASSGAGPRPFVWTLEGHDTDLVRVPPSESPSAGIDTPPELLGEFTLERDGEDAGALQVRVTKAGGQYRIARGTTDSGDWYDKHPVSVLEVEDAVPVPDAKAEELLNVDRGYASAQALQATTAAVLRMPPGTRIGSVTYEQGLALRTVEGGQVSIAPMYRVRAPG